MPSIDLGEDTAKILQVFDLSDLDPRVAESKKTPVVWNPVNSPVEVGNRLVVYPCLSQYLHGSPNPKWLAGFLNHQQAVWYNTNVVHPWIRTARTSNLTQLKRKIIFQTTPTCIFESQVTTGWWLNQPIWKIMKNMLKLQIFPENRVNIQNIWNQHLEMVYKMVPFRERSHIPTWEKENDRLKSAKR